jgi:hypothetical protein
VLFLPSSLMVLALASRTPFFSWFIRVPFQKACSTITYKIKQWSVFIIFLITVSSIPEPCMNTCHIDQMKYDFQVEATTLDVGSIQLNEHVMQINTSHKSVVLFYYCKPRDIHMLFSSNRPPSDIFNGLLTFISGYKVNCLIVNPFQ